MHWQSWRVEGRLFTRVYTDRYNVILRLWTPALRLTWGLRDATGYGIGQRTWSIGF